MPTCATCCRNCLGRGLDSMSSAAPFQPLQFCDAVISGVARLGSAPLGRGMAPPAGDVSRELQESIRRALGRPRIHLLLRARLETKPRRLEERILALTAWRLHLFGPTTPAKAEGSLSVLEIRCISATSPTQCLPVHPVPRCAWTRSGVPWPWPLPALLLPPAWPGSWEPPWGGPCPVPPPCEPCLGCAGRGLGRAVGGSTTQGTLRGPWGNLGGSWGIIGPRSRCSLRRSRQRF
ncbi:uncharacterized protein LOC128091961 isoform X3 [Tympanuchus pallidicinctus]|uniref:uncharacterized protein LOC128091961 isoform X3 n=1 Tax=Tympanuchus pallidicinctus TaxID=109042 RepID=UPI0022876502|nr:uncharacterized protein LOC128091961 isoform X3 [Tympanuchus pallidicinctus]